MEDARTIAGVEYRRRSRRCIVEFDDGERIKFDMDVVVEYALAKGRRIAPDEFAEIYGRQRTIELRQAAFNYASYKPRTEFEVINKLREKGFESDEIDRALGFLAEFNLLDDEAYARNFVKNYLQKKPSAPPRIIMELRRRGIPRDIAELAIEAAYPDGIKSNLAREAAQKKMRSIEGKPPEKQRRSLAGYLQRLGFDWGTIKEIEQEYFERT
ncbi:MAG: regulatory protein RecX [Candidatus Kapaibacterium sp.]